MDKLPYQFHDRQREISFSRFDLPSPWINYLSNGRMHAFVSQAGGGMSWWLSPMMFRLTRYRFYNMPIDSPGFYVYLRMADGTVWSPTFRPCETSVDFRESSHAPGFSTFTAKKDGLTATLKLFMAQDYDALVWELELTNESGEEISCDVFAYVELSQFLAREENILGYYLKWNTRAVFDEDLQAITYAYTAWMHPRKDESPLVFFGSDAKIDSFCCNRDLFCGNYRDERNPVEVQNGRLSNTNLQGGEPCGALHTHISLLAGAEKKIHFFLGVTEGALSDYDKAVSSAKDTLTALRKDGAVDQQFAKLQSWWKEHLVVYQCDIPDADAQRMINTWNPLQSVQTARYSRSISSDASGVRGIGFRDTAQDMLAQAYRKPEWATEILWYLASQQLEDGHAVHTAWPEEKRPPQDITRSDDHIWMVYLAYAIAAETGDLRFLEKEIPFLGTDLVTPVGSATLWEHLLRGVDFTEKHLGVHGLPLILFSDWNDHLGPFGRKGKGESIMVSKLELAAATEADNKLIAQIEDVKNVVAGVRAVRNSKNIAQKEVVDLQVVESNPVEAFNSVIIKMANLSGIEVVAAKGDGTAAFLVGTTEYAVPLGNLIDMDAEIAKQEAELKHLEGFLAGVMKKLGNERFVANAPEQVVALERKKQSDAETKMAALKESLAKLKE